MALANALAILLYLSCSVILIRHFFQRDQSVAGGLIPTSILAVLALIFHASDIAFSMINVGGWNLSLFSSLSIATWIMALLALLMGHKSPSAHPGTLIYPITLISLVLKYSLASEQVTTLSNPALEWHILLSLSAYSLLSLAALLAVILAIQERQLRQHQTNKLLRQLPPLQTMEQGLFQLIITGFIFLTVGFITGVIFIENLFAQQLVHKTILSLIAWSVFAALLWGRFKYGWRGLTATKWTLTGFIFLVLAYFGSKFVLEFILTSAT